MKTVKFNEEEVELLIALYEDELKEAESYIDRLNQTLSKLKEKSKIETTEAPKTGKKRGRKPKVQADVVKPIYTGKKRGRKPKVQEVTTLDSALEVKKTGKKKRGRKPKNQVVLKTKKQKTANTATEIIPDINSTSI